MNDTKDILIIGLGHAGISVLREIHTLAKYEDFQLIAIDSDEKDIKAAQSTGVQTVQLGTETLHGCGTGDDWEMGSHLLEDEEKYLAKLAQKRRQIIVISGLAGGMGGASETLISAMSEEDIPIVLLGIMPFHFESTERKAHADDALARLALLCRAIILAPNDLLMAAHPDFTPAQAFSAATSFLAMATIDLTTPLAKNNLFNINPELIGTICVNSNPQCFIAQETWNENDTQLLCNKLTENPLFKIPRFKENTDKAIVMLRVSGNCTAVDMDNVLSDIAQLLPPGIMETAACEDTELQTKMRVTILLHFKGNFRQTEENAIRKSKSTSRKRNSQTNDSQMEISYDASASLGIFADDKQPPDKKDCLDLPTFIRLGIDIDKGDFINHN